MLFVLTGSLLLLLLFGASEAIRCPSSYVPIAMGCYKINNGSFLMWSEARQYCQNQSATLLPTWPGYVPNATTHLFALELDMEKTAFINWMKAYQMENVFWIDGIVSSSTWDWSNQSITWFFDSNERAVIGNGSNYKFAYNSNESTYQIADDVNSTPLNYICEYQVPCNQSNGCQNNATCYLNIGQELCICAPGFTGLICDTEIDECLSSPCQHGGLCTNAINNYTCNCSQIFFEGSNCEIPTSDPRQYNRAAAFWSVVGIVCGLVVILTLSDVPWARILKVFGRLYHRFTCCSKQNHNNDDGNMNDKNLRLSGAATNDHGSEAKLISISGGTPATKGMNYHVMNTVWNPEQIRNETPPNPKYNGYRSPDQRTTPDNALIQSFASSVRAQEKQKELNDKRIYAVNINEPRKSTSQSTDPVDTMVSWTQQLQEQLKNPKPRETSASSTKQLIHSSNTNDN